MLNTDIRKNLLWKLVGSDSHWSVPPLFCDFIIAYFFPFFNWHFYRSFLKVFVKQGEVLTTFKNCIYKIHFLWYNKNVGACCKTGLFSFAENQAFYRKPGSSAHPGKKITPPFHTETSGGSARSLRGTWNNPWSRFPTQPRVISVHSWYLTSFLVLSFFLLKVYSWNQKTFGEFALEDFCSFALSILPP